MSWGLLDAEFDKWRGAGKAVPFWWRDDDAVAETPALHQLTALSAKVNVPVHLAVIPAQLEDNLAPFVQENKELHPIIHGYAHQSFAQAGEKKCEFPAGRSDHDVQQGLQQGYDVLSAAFGARLVPMFVPPWNRFAPNHLSKLAALGYRGFSTFTPRQRPFAIAGMAQINTHVDPIDWHGSRSLADPDLILHHTVKTLEDRRLGRTDQAEPLGFLTHHLVHDPEIWDFSERFLSAFMNGPTRVWTAADLNETGE